MCAVETVEEVFVFCHHTNEMEIGSSGWDGFVNLCWMVGQHYTSEPVVCIMDCLSALQVGEAYCSQTDLYALVLMLFWAEGHEGMFVQVPIPAVSVGGWGTWEF